jgi:hypothetical protein
MLPEERGKWERLERKFNELADWANDEIAVAWEK